MRDPDGQKKAPRSAGTLRGANSNSGTEQATRPRIQAPGVKQWAWWGSRLGWVQVWRKATPGGGGKGSP